ncbi:hypothetical protein, partial [Kitasatospora sp. NPDC056181]|uniref:hypothetical protein n=1 Tax=Kitasatospora sp. NPDC056181 TaxID=3345737 RepID=UPI0035D81B7F
MNRSTRAARLLLMPLLASALALTGPLPAASAAPTAPTADPAFLPELVVPGQPLPQPRTEELIGAGATGFLHRTRDNRYAWTAYETGATVYTTEFSDTYRFNDPIWHGVGSDVIIKSVPRMDTLDWQLKDTAANTTVTVTSPRTDSPAGIYGDALLTQTFVPENPNSGTLKISALTFRRADASGATVSVPVIGWPDASGAPGRIRFLGGDAREAALGFNDAAGKYRIALADTHTGALRVSPAVAATDSAISWCPGASAVGINRIAWVANDCNVHLLARADLAAVETVLPFGSAQKPEALGISGDWLLSVAHPDGSDANSPTPVQKELKASLIPSSGTTVTLMSHASPTMTQAPDGTVLVEGGDNSSDWRVRRITGVGNAPASVSATGYRVEPDAYKVVTLDLSENVLTTAEAGSAVGQGFEERQITLGGAPTVGARMPLGTDLYPYPSQLCMAGSDVCNTMVGTGDGRVVHPGAHGGLVVRQGRTARAVNLPPGLPAQGLVEASGRYVLVNTSTYQHPGQLVVDLDSPVPGAQVATVSSYSATIDEVTLYSPGTNSGEITAFNLATRQTWTVQTGRTCAITRLKSSRGWLYWSCDAQQLAGVLRPASGSVIDVPSGAAAMGDGFLLYTDLGSWSRVVDFHTGTPSTSKINANVRADGHSSPWSVDRFGSGLAFADELSNLHLVSVTAADHGTTFTSVSPDRLLDTRSAVGRAGTDKVPGRSTVAVQVTGRGNVPVGAKAAVLNVTATETDGPGHLIAWASGSPQPTSSNLNWTASGVTTPNLVIV